MQRQPLISPARSTADCLPGSLLQAVASGELQEPLLGVYLAHLESCDACCVRLERETGWHRRFDAVPEPDYRQPAAGISADSLADPRLGSWLEQLKQTTAIDSATQDFQIGARIGPFRATASLGEGASAVVYEAVDEDLARPVVLKVLRPAHDDCPEQHRLLISEARALAALQHDSIMPLLQILWHDGSPVLVFPRLPGETLADALASGRCSPRMALAVVRDVASALAHTHEQGIFHHDIKPSNIWLCRRGPRKQESALLFDFGLTGSTTAAAGTPGYADPELTAASDPKSRDLFSLGVVLHECLATSGAMPAGCRDLVRRLTAADPAARPRAGEVAAEIDRLLTPLPAAWRRVAAAAVILAGLAAAWAFTSSRPGPDGEIQLQSAPLAADVVIPGNGLPVAISGDGRARCFVADGSVLRIEPISGGAAVTSVPIGFRPDRLAFNEPANRLAAADASGNLAIIDIPSATVTLTHRFADGVAWLGWAGWNRDAVVVLSGHAVHAFFRTRRGTPALDALPEWLGQELRDDIRAIATLPGTEAVLSMDPVGQLTMWSVGRLTEDMPVRLSLINASQPKNPWIIGWKSRGVCFVAEGRLVTEFAPYHGIDSHQIPAPAKAIAWPGESMLVMLTDEPGGNSRLLLTDRSRPGWSRAFDLGGATIETISLLADRDRIAAITADGGVRIYSLRLQR